MNKGKVKFFNESKGFGFVIDDESKVEYFVHVSGLNDEIREGDEVEFDLQEGRKGMNAVMLNLFNIYSNSLWMEPVEFYRLFYYLPVIILIINFA